MGGFLRLPMNLGQLCGHPGSQGGRCSFLVFCLQREKVWLLWISYPTLGERPHPHWAFGCLFQLLVTTSKGYLNCESSLLLREVQKCLLLDSVIFLCGQVFLLLFLLIVLILKLLFLLFFGNRWVWVETMNMRPLTFASYWKFKCLPIPSDVTGRIRSAGGDSTDELLRRKFSFCKSSFWKKLGCLELQGSRVMIQTEKQE